MGTDIAIVEGVRQGVLGDDVKIATIELGIAFGLFKALSKDHIGRHKAPRIGTAEDKAVLWKIGKHVVPVHPTEPMITLGAFRK